FSFGNTYCLQIMSRISESSLIGCKTELLIEEATKVVESKIRSLVGAAELSAEEYTALELESWRNLHSFCQQYHSAENKPLGLFIDPKTGFKGIIKKANIEFPVKNDPMDDIIDDSFFDNKYDLSLVCDDPSLESSLSLLLKSVSLINESLIDDDLIAFEAFLLKGESPITAAEALIDNSLMLTTDPRSLTGEPLKHSFDNIQSKAPQLLDAILLMIKTLESYLKDANEEQSAILMDGSQTISPIFQNCLSSSRGLNLLSESVKRVVRLRFNFCRDLLLFQSFLTKLRNKESLEIIEKINCNTIPMTAEILNAYYLMAWICETPMSLGSFGSVAAEDSVALLSLLELNEYINVSRSGTSSALLFDCGPKTIINYFIQNNGGVLAKKLLTNKFKRSDENISNLEIWTTIMPQFVHSIVLLISPLTTHFHLPEFLLGFGQHNLLMEYINKLDVWCEWNSNSRLFLKALCYLIIGESYKSVSLFNRALFGVNEDLFLKRIIIGNNREIEVEDESDAIKSNIIYKYYNKLLQLFAIYGSPDSVIEVVDSALSALDKSDPNYDEHISSLYSTKFMAHLELENTTEAYETMISNPDVSHKKICLRQFIVHHCESGQLSALTAFTYNDIEDEFVNIIESRARSTDLLLSNHVNYYHLLYSYFVRDSNYRRAASVMYEFCRRLSQEVNGMESIQKQHSFKRDNTSPLTKRKHDSNIKRSVDPEVENFRKSLELEILDSDDIKREYELVRARYRLLQKDEKTYAIANTPLDATETVTLLISASLFDLAFDLCSLLKLKFEPIFEGIVSKYIYLVQSGNSYEIVDVYDCFVDNDTPSLGFINAADMSPVDKMWHLISAYIDRYEAEGQTCLKKCVAEKLLANGLMIPTCLKLKYQRVLNKVRQNCPELLRLLMTYDFIEEAFNLSVEYMRAFEGKGTEYFDIRTLSAKL
ncbi:unnamed protein product, partial [Oppiella nova]